MGDGLALSMVIAAIVIAALPLLLQNGIHALWATLVLAFCGLVLYWAFATSEIPVFVITSAAVIALMGWIASQLERRTRLSLEEGGAASVTVVFAALMGGAFLEELVKKGYPAADWRYLFIGTGALLIMAAIIAIRVWRRTLPDEPVPAAANEVAATEQPEPDSAPVEQTEPFLRDVVVAREWADSEVEKTVEAHRQDLDEQFSEDLKLKERLAAFAVEQRLDEAIIDLWQELKHYPASYTLPDFRSTERLRVSNVKASRVNDLESITFTYQGHRYTIAAREWGGMGDTYRDFALHEDGNEVFGINCSLDQAATAPRYAAYDVTTFRKRGHWARMLLDLHHHLRIRSGIRTAESRYHGAAGIKGRFEE